uniref:Uncharacterized protein n=1 Tax=Klebsiella phage vB_KpnM_Iguana_ER37 TaxID=3076781 RepID=A0AB38Z3R4_9CAUD
MYNDKVKSSAVDRFAMRPRTVTIIRTEQGLMSILPINAHHGNCPRVAFSRRIDKGKWRNW